MTPEKLSGAYLNACIAELEALKPGNVHIFADGHRMTVNDFIKSAEVSSVLITQVNLTVGQRIYHSVKATQATVGMNTNLGIILLCAPIIHAALTFKSNAGLSFHQHLISILNLLTIEDASLTAQAIVLANPAGLGDVGENDVKNTPTINLLHLMALIQHQDRIAWQYANSFIDIFDFGLAKYAQAVSRWQEFANSRQQNQSWATTALYLSFLARQLDSHIVRKYGELLAIEVMQEAREMQVLFWTASNPKLVQKKMLLWDQTLKRRNINPGTTADLTVACLMMDKINKIARHFS